MTRLAELGRRLLMLFRRRQLDRDLQEEMRLHLDLRVNEHTDAGAPASEARRAAHVRFGNDRLLRERSSEMWRWSRLESLLQDARYGARTMLRSPAVLIVAVLSLALGIGANTAIFSLMDALMFRALPVERPQELVLFGEGRSAGSTDDFPGVDPQLFSYPFYRDLEQNNHVFSGATAMLSLLLAEHGTVSGEEASQQVSVVLVSGNYFSVLGVRPAIGRLLTGADDGAPGGHPVAVASDAWWRRRFGRDPSVVGKTVTMRSTDFTIIGVTPPEFFGTTVGSSPDLWIPLAMSAEVSPGWPGHRLTNDSFQSLNILGRLRPGVTLTRATADVNQVYRDALTMEAGAGMSDEVRGRIQRAGITLTTAATGLSRLRRRFSEPLQILLVIVGLVLLIACVNIANLLLARSAARRREIAVRQTLGAQRLRLVQQLLTESLLLALIGGGLGLAFAAWASHLLLRLVSGGPDPLPVRVAVDGRVLLFNIAVSVVTAIAFGIVPALRATRPTLTSALKEGRGPAGAEVRSRLAKGLVVSQVAVSLVLLVSSVLLLHSLIDLMGASTGFDKDHVLRLQVDVSSAGYEEDAHLMVLYQQIETRVAALPGIRAASFSLFTFNEGEWTDHIHVHGYMADGVDSTVTHNVVGAGYFATMGIPVVSGRSFGPKDTGTSMKVAVINEIMARRLFPAGSPVGRVFDIDGEPPPRNYTVVGIVKDAKYGSLSESPQPADYLLYSQHVQYISDFEARTAGDPSAAVPDVRRAIASIDPHLPISDVTTLAAQVDGSIVSERLVAQLSSFFGLLALCLTCIGIYGVMTYAVTRRTNEIGVRMALGAPRSRVLWSVMRESLVLVGLGTAFGLPISLAFSNLASSALFGLGRIDAASIAVAPAVLLVVAAIAGFLPARRASNVDPMIALRHE